SGGLPLRTMSPGPPRSGDRLDDGLVQAGELGQVLGPLGLQALDMAPVLVAAALALVQPAGLEQLGVVDAGALGGDLVAEGGRGAQLMVPPAMALTMAEECGMRTFLERSSPSGPPTRPVLSRNTSSGWVSSSS